jgi:chorismate dehydratase
MNLQHLRLGHISYSNCFPVHARLIADPRPGDPRLVEGIPSELNRALESGGIDVAPCSSIEFARHPDRYRIIPDLVIGSRGPVRSIRFLVDRHPGELDGAVVAIPTASATSVLLLKILLRNRWGVRPRYRWFDQASEDPFAAGAAGALVIGDVALRDRRFPELPLRLDLGEEWYDETGLPFAFAMWQAAAGSHTELRGLHRLLLDSRAFGKAERESLATRFADRFGMPADTLANYWAALAFDLDGEMLEALTLFYQLSAEIGELERVPELRWAG